jgi:hypothetical protein
VEYPLRKPDWFSLKTEKDSENSINLSFSIAVKSLPRQLTIVSKLFTAILNERLIEFSESFSVLSENQSGFRKGYSTSDNMFTLQSFFEILKCKKKKMYCCSEKFTEATYNCNRSIIFGVKFIAFILIDRFYHPN